MTPYVLNDNESDSAQKPKSIMVCGANGDVNGTSVKTNGNIAETPDSIPSRSTVSGKSIIGNGSKNGKNGALKRVSFGSSKGSMVETLVYDHLDDLPTDQPLPPYATPPLVNGEESRLHPAKVRVKFIESQPLAQVLTCPSSTPSSPDVTLDLSTSDTMTSPTSDNYARQISVESGIDNPFRPDGELSREADTIVSLIKEGKPITTLKVDDVMVDGILANGHTSDGGTNTDSMVAKEAIITPTDASGAKVESKRDANGSGPKGHCGNNAASPGIIEVKHGVISPQAETPQVEQVTIKKKKSGCCVIQ